MAISGIVEKNLCKIICQRRPFQVANEVPFFQVIPVNGENSPSEFHFLPTEEALKVLYLLIPPHTESSLIM